MQPQCLITNMIHFNGMTLSLLVQDDLAFFVDVYTNEQLMVNVMTVLDANTCEKYFHRVLKKMHLNPPEELFYVIRDESNKALGMMGFYWNQQCPQYAEIGAIILPECQGQGVATAATRAMARHGFSELGLEQIILLCEEDNVGANKTAQHAGFSLLHSGHKNAHGQLCNDWRLIKPQQNKDSQEYTNA